MKPHLRVAEPPAPSLEDSIFGLKVVLAQFQERLEALEARSFLSEARHDVDVQAIRLRLDALQAR